MAIRFPTTQGTGSSGTPCNCESECSDDTGKLYLRVAIERPRGYSFKKLKREAQFLSQIGAGNANFTTTTIDYVGEFAVGIGQTKNTPRLAVSNIITFSIQNQRTKEYDSFITHTFNGFDLSWNDDKRENQNFVPWDKVFSYYDDYSSAIWNVKETYILPKIYNVFDGPPDLDPEDASQNVYPTQKADPFLDAEITSTFSYIDSYAVYDITVPSQYVIGDRTINAYIHMDQLNNLGGEAYFKYAFDVLVAPKGQDITYIDTHETSLNITNTSYYGSTYISQEEVAETHYTNQDPPCVSEWRDYTENCVIPSNSLPVPLGGQQTRCDGTIVSREAMQGVPFVCATPENDPQTEAYKTLVLEGYMQPPGMP